ncbi:hypothetical protein QOZ80_6BG0503340 [Eleusine coracana subsp. coracana]|nr:hypothetical protein QOZ80_6BG0503340 [Eleusine coracana subsp. coracana]
MGCAFSSSGPGGSLPPFSGVRVIHTNGYVEDFPGPGVVTVAHVTGGKSSSPPRYVLCSSAHLLQPGRGPFRPDDALQPGTVYFLLPQSVFQSESSAVDLACLMNRLTALARKSSCVANAAATQGPTSTAVEALFHAAAQAQGQRQNAAPLAQQGAKVSSPARAKPWRPRLDRIDESFGRSSMRSSSCSEA